MMSPLLKDQAVSYWSFAITIFDKFYSVERYLTQKNAAETNYLSTLNTGVHADYEQ